MNNIKFVFGCLFLIINTSYAQAIFDSDPWTKEANDYLEQKIDKIVINDTISTIKGLLSKFESNPKPSDYLKKYIINDSLFEKYKEDYKQTEWYPERIKKRKDLVILFYIHFELYLKYKVPKDFDIVNIYLTTNEFKNDKVFKMPSIILMEAPYCEIGNKYFADKKISSEEFVHYYYPDQKAMEEIYGYYKKWIKKVEKLGSLEKARKKGLNPFKKSEYKWCLNYYKKSNSIFYNSFFPRYQYVELSLSPEINNKEWSSSYFDKNVRQ